MIKFVFTVLHVASVLGARDCEKDEDCENRDTCANVKVISGNYRDDPRVCVETSLCDKNKELSSGAIVRYDCGGGSSGGSSSNFIDSGGNTNTQYSTSWLFPTESQYDWFISREVTEAIVSFSGGNSSAWDAF